MVSPHSCRESDSEALSIAAPADQPEQKKAKATPAQLQCVALEALEAGNLSELDQVVMKLMEKPAEQEAKQESAEEKFAQTYISSESPSAVGSRGRRRVRSSSISSAEVCG